MAFSTLDNKAFKCLKSEIENHPRMCGYYIINIVGISNFPLDAQERGSLLNEVFEHFDDQQWPPIYEDQSEQTWDDHEVEREKARSHLIEALIGGNSIGHTIDTIPSTLAKEFWNRFESLFADSRRYYMSMGLGDPAYVFLRGVAIVDNDKAGIISIVEGD